MYYFLNLLIPKNCFTVIIKHADCCPTPFFSLTIFTVMIEVSEKWQRKLKATFYMYKCYSYFSALVPTFINFCRVISWIMQIWITQILGLIRAAMPPSSLPYFLCAHPNHIFVFWFAKWFVKCFQYASVNTRSMYTPLCRSVLCLICHFLYDRNTT